MEQALSLKSNRIISAKEVCYETSKLLIPVCPECKEPVHLRRKISTTGTAYFAHHVQKGDKHGVCSLRVYGYWGESHDSSVMWESRGQLIEKIHLELISFFSDQFGETKYATIKAIKDLIIEYREFDWIYTDLLDHLAEANPIYSKVREETTLGNEEGREIVIHYNLALDCLRGSRLEMATQGLLWCSFIVAHSLSGIYKKDSNPPVGVICNGREFDFCIDPKKYRSVILGRVAYPSVRNEIYYRCVSIGQRLLIRLLASWRYPHSLRRSFLGVCEKPALMSEVRKESLSEDLTTPYFRTLEERNKWLLEKKG